MITPLHSRIAPTPSGFLHIGNVLSFLITWLIVRKTKGTLSLRIDDMDEKRVQPPYIQDIFDTLRWLEIDYDKGPKNLQDFEANFSQKLRMKQYNQVLFQLKEQGDLFACNCSRKHIKRNSFDGQYPTTCRSMQRNFNAPQHAWRILTPSGQPTSYQEINASSSSVDLYLKMRDFVVKRKDNLPAYQLVSLVEDTLSEVNLIVRGIDLRASTAAQIYLAEKLSYDSFQKVIFFHHPLIYGSDQQKLSKSNAAPSIKAIRKEKKNPVYIYRFVARQLGIVPQRIHNKEDLLQAFNMNLLSNLS